MRERKVWNQYEDKILKYLREEKGESKWSIIAKKMQEEFQMSGRTGKQCRERYHNHLDSSIITAYWTTQEDDLLYKLHQQFGNKWSSISQVIKGRSDNCVKNHFYSKLRKSTRKLNKIIEQFFMDQYQPLSTRLISKIIETNEEKFKTSTKIDEHIIQCSNSLKNKLYKFENQVDQKIEEEQDINYAKCLIDQIIVFSKFVKKAKSPQKKRKKSLQFNQLFLHPTINLKKSTSFGSERNQKSSQSSLLWSSSNLSSFDEELDDDECYGVNIRVRSMTQTKCSKNLTTSRNSNQSEINNNFELKPMNTKIKKSLSHDSSSNKFKGGLVHKETTYQKEQNLQNEAMRDEKQQQKQTKNNYMLDQQVNYVNRKERSSLESRNSSSRSEEKVRQFPRNIDQFNEIEQKLSCFHFNMKYQAEQQVIWRVFQPRNRNNISENQPFEQEQSIQYGQSQQVE